MNSILHNSAAMSALQSLSLTQQALSTTQNQVSSGLAVSKASDNAAYWSIAQHLNADNGMVTAANSVMTQSQAILDTANTAIQNVITTINSIQTALTQATNPGADLTNIGTTLASLGKQLTDAISAASFNGTNILDGGNAAVFGTSANSNQNTSISFVSGYDANAQKRDHGHHDLAGPGHVRQPADAGVRRLHGGRGGSCGHRLPRRGARRGCRRRRTAATYDLTQLSNYTTAANSPAGTLATFDSSGDQFLQQTTRRPAFRTCWSRLTPRFPTSPTTPHRSAPPRPVCRR